MYRLLNMRSLIVIVFTTGSGWNARRVFLFAKMVQPYKML